MGASWLLGSVAPWLRGMGACMLARATREVGTCRANRLEPAVGVRHLRRSSRSRTTAAAAVDRQARVETTSASAAAESSDSASAGPLEVALERSPTSEASAPSNKASRSPFKASMRSAEKS